MKQQLKTLEQTLREKIATGYDPVTLNVAVRAVNEENIEVSIEGQKYSVRGNAVSEVHGRGAFTASGGPVGEAVEPTPEEGNTNSPKSDPDDTGEIKGDEVAADVAGDEGSGKSDTGAGDVTARLQAVTDHFGTETQPWDKDEAGEVRFSVVDASGNQLIGTLAELEEVIEAQKTSAAA